MRSTYEPHQQTTYQYQIPDLGQVQTIAAGFKLLIIPNLHPHLKQ